MANAQAVKVLVVDDNSMVRGLNKKILRNFGFEITEAENGKVAVDLFCDGKEFDLVLMDKEMPEMDGMKATKAIKEKGVDAKIVAITGDESANGAFLEVGADAFLVKPTNLNELTNLLKNFNLLN